MSDAMTDMRNNKKLRDQLASRDAEIAELKVVSDHNLHIYQEAASKMRAEIADMQEQIETLEREIDARDSWKDIIKERDQLREQVTLLRDELNTIYKLVPDLVVLMKPPALAATEELK